MIVPVSGPRSPQCFHNCLIARDHVLSPISSAKLLSRSFRSRQICHSCSWRGSEASMVGLCVRHQHEIDDVSQTWCQSMPRDSIASPSLSRPRCEISRSLSPVTTAVAPGPGASRRRRLDPPACRNGGSGRPAAAGAVLERYEEFVFFHLGTPAQPPIASITVGARAIVKELRVLMSATCHLLPNTGNPHA